MGNNNTTHSSDHSGGLNRLRRASAGVAERLHGSHKSHEPTPTIPISPKSNSLSASPGMSRSASGSDINERNYTQFVPLEKLAKILQQKSHDQSGITGVDSEIFANFVFPQNTEFGSILFAYMHLQSKAQTKHLGVIAFRQQCERIIGLLDDALIIETYVKMFTDQDNGDLITVDGLSHLLMICFQLAMANYSESQVKGCPLIHRTIKSVTASCFFSKDSLSIGFICRWFEQNCPRLIPPIHQFCVHRLTTAYRTIEAAVSNVDQNLAGSPLELATPILESMSSPDFTVSLMPLSQAWLLASSLPPIYSKPQKIMPPNGSDENHQPDKNVGAVASAQKTFISKLLSNVPSHWTLLYDSRQHGVGSNRFLHHVLGYKGPTLCLLHAADEQVFCVASSTEWRETHLYTGDKEACLLQLLPKFHFIEHGPKILYLNTSTRGYPKGFRAGSDPRKPIVSVDEYFEKIECRGISSILNTIEVWGCGDNKSREIQLDIKKWQVKEAERQRTVKLTAADWKENPDRYLLELGGRPQYNNSN